VLIQEPFGEDLIRTPLKVYGPALPGAHEWNTTLLRGVRASFVPGAGGRWMTETVPRLGQV